jgi:Fanconi anemia group M protein
MSKLAEVLKIDHALLLLETQCVYSMNTYIEKLKEQDSKAVERLFKDEKFITAVALAKQYIDSGKEHPKIARLRELVKEELEKDKYTGIIIFVQFRDTIGKIIEALKDIRNAAPVEFIGQQKKKGRGLSQKEQIQILNEFKMGFYNILVASQVGEEGLDIEETNTVIFYEPVPSAVRRVQRSGRTARTHPGNVIVMITKNTRDEAYHWAGHHKEKKMKRVLQDMQQQHELTDIIEKEKTGE